MKMRTNIDLDEGLVEEAFRYVDVRTKKELVHVALQELVERHRRKPGTPSQLSRWIMMPSK
jgi:Arc/MetJ family transcription regulator